MRPTSQALLIFACTAVLRASLFGAAAPPRDWPLLAEQTRAAALQADRTDDPVTLEIVRAHRWARLFAKPETKAYRDWIVALRGSQVGAQLARGDYRVAERPLAEIAPADAVEQWLGDPAIGDRLFATLAPTDNVARVLELLGTIAQRYPEDAARHFNLALAIAVVFDTSPRADWPHAQVGEHQLSRRWPDPAEAFAFWRDEARAGRLFFPLERMTATELTHVVDAVASFDELRWAQALLPVAARSADVDALLAKVPVQNGRLTSGEFQWPYADYRLQTLLATGGVCVDRAYFVTQVLKSRGVPAALLAGSGQGGRHAWIGYQPVAGGRWRLDCGRDDATRVFTGMALDPQSWREIDEWEMRRWGGPLADDRRHAAAALQSELAALWRDEGQAEFALRAAYRTVALEPLESRWWDDLLAVCDAVRGPHDAERETILRNAIAVSWPDPAIEARYVRSLAEELERRGDLTLAATEWERFSDRLRYSGLDRQLDGARERIAQEFERGRLDVARPLARHVIAAQGREAGVALLDRFVFPLVKQLRGAGQAQEAELLLTQTRNQVASRVPGVAKELARAGYE